MTFMIVYAILSVAFFVAVIVHDASIGHDITVGDILLVGIATLIPIFNIITLFWLACDVVNWYKLLDYKVIKSKA